MPLHETPYPHLLSTLSSSTTSNPTYLIFYSPPDPKTNKLWCPDCQAVEGPIKRAFEAEGGPKGVIHWVGQREEWRKQDNEARVRWGVTNIPTILKLVEGKEVDRLVEKDILKQGQLDKFLSN